MFMRYKRHRGKPFLPLKISLLCHRYHFDVFVAINHHDHHQHPCVSTYFPISLNYCKSIVDIIYLYFFDIEDRWYRKDSTNVPWMGGIVSLLICSLHQDLL